jgi:hypothetical protein
MGLASFSYTNFSVDDNGFVSLITSGITSVATQIFTSSGMYTPTAGMIYCFVEMLGGGGAGGGAGTSPTYNSMGGGGGAGEYCRSLFTAATIGSSQTITIGAGVTGVAAATGNDGGTTSIGTLMTALGGQGPQGGARRAPEVIKLLQVAMDLRKARKGGPFGPRKWRIRPARGGPKGPGPPQGEQAAILGLMVLPETLLYLTQAYWLYLEKEQIASLVKEALPMHRELWKWRFRLWIWRKWSFRKQSIYKLFWW